MLTISLFQVMQAYAEADTFFCFVELLSGFRDHFCQQLDNSVVGIRSTITRLSQLLKEHDEEVWRHLEVTTKVRAESTIYIYYFFLFLCKNLPCLLFQIYDFLDRPWGDYEGGAWQELNLERVSESRDIARKIIISKSSRLITTEILVWQFLERYHENLKFSAWNTNISGDILAILPHFGTNPVPAGQESMSS